MNSQPGCITKNSQNDLLAANAEALTIIQPNPTWKIIDFKELQEYRDLFFFLVWRDLKALYAQTILGFLWALLNPLIQIVLFTIIFGEMAKMPSDGIPYALFSTVAIVPWAYMSSSMGQSSQSLIQGSAMLGKIYFPRLLFPLTPVLSRLVDFGISIILILCVMLYYQVQPTWNLLLLPFLLVFTMAIPSGVGLWLSSLAIRFRDVKQAMPFFMQMLMWTGPIVYPTSLISEEYRLIYSINPIVGVIEGYRACLLGGPIPWEYIVPGIFTAALLVITGAFYFKRMERIIVDVI